MTPPYSASAVGEVLVPAGIYTLSAPVVLGAGLGGDYSVIITGQGDVSHVGGNFIDYVFKRVTSPYAVGGGIVIIQNIRIDNPALLGGAIQLGSTICSSILNCDINADLGVVAEQSPNNIDLTAFTSTIDTCRFSPQNPWAVGSNAIIIANNSTVLDCDVSRFDVGVRMYGTACNIIGGRYEVNNTGFMLGQYPDGTKNALTAFLIAGVSIESNYIGIWAAGSIGSGTMSGILINAFQSACPYTNAYVAVTTTTITSQTSGATNAVFTGNITSGGVLTITGTTSGTLALSDTLSGTGVTLGTVALTKLSGTLGAIGSTYQCKGSPQYGLRIEPDNFAGCTFQGVRAAGTYNLYAMSIGDRGNERGYNTFIDCIASNGSTIGGLTWQMPAFAITAQFISCNNPKAAYAYANLPQPNSITASCAGNQLTVTSSGTGTISVDQLLNAAGYAPGTRIIGNRAGGGGPGVYILNTSQTVASGTVKAYQNMVGGDQYDIVDCGVATFLATATAGGTGATAFRRVRFNDVLFDWQVIG